MNIDLLCGHETMLHCGCRICARNAALEEAAKVAETIFDNGKPTHRGTNAARYSAGQLIAEAIRALKGKAGE